MALGMLCRRTVLVTLAQVAAMSPMPRVGAVAAPEELTVKIPFPERDHEQEALGSGLPEESRAKTVSWTEAPRITRLSGAVIQTEAGFCACSKRGTKSGQRFIQIPHPQT